VIGHDMPTRPGFGGVKHKPTVEPQKTYFRSLHSYCSPPVPACLRSAPCSVGARNQQIGMSWTPRTCWHLPHSILWPDFQ